MYRLFVLVALTSSACSLSGKLGGSVGGSSPSHPSPRSTPAPSTPSSQPPSQTSSAPPPVATPTNAAPEASAETSDQRRARAGLAESAKRAAHNASEIFDHLRAGRDGTAPPKLTSFEHRDAFYVEHRLGMLERNMDLVETVATACTAGVFEDSDRCDLATNRDKYWPKALAGQFTVVLDDRLEAWNNTIERLRKEGVVAVINFNKISDRKALAADLGKDLAAIGKVLRQTNTKGAIDARLAKLHAEFMAVLRDKQKQNAWAARASHAKHKDAAIVRAARDSDGLQLVRVASPHASWDIVRGANNRPIKRERAIWVLLKKKGESFCRLYPLYAVEDHLGGGRYGNSHARSFGAAEFYPSTCK